MRERCKRKKNEEIGEKGVDNMANHLLSLHIDLMLLSSKMQLKRTMVIAVYLT